MSGEDPPADQSRPTASTWLQPLHFLWANVATTLQKVVFAGVVTLVASLGLLIYHQEKLIFQPKEPRGYEVSEKNPHPFRNPSQAGIHYEVVKILTEDGLKLQGWLMLHPKSAAGYVAGDSSVTGGITKSSRPTIIFFQGNAGNLGFRIGFFHKLYVECGFNILAVAYRGFDHSEGIPSEKGIFDDAQSTLNFLVNEKSDVVDVSNIYVMGRSIGGGVAVDLATKNDKIISGLILENTFTSIQDVATALLPFLRGVQFLIDYFLRVKMNNLFKMKYINVPVLFICGLKDDLVPPHNTIKLYQACASNFKEIQKFPQGTHNETWQDTNYCPALKAFVEEITKKNKSDLRHSMNPIRPHFTEKDKTQSDKCKAL